MSDHNLAVPGVFQAEPDGQPTWYGIMFTDRSFTVKRYFDYKDLQEAEGSDFVMYTTRLFSADNRADAMVEGKRLMKVLVGV